MYKGLPPITDSDMDSMFILPLSVLPLKTPSLQTARILKNSRLESAVEVFRDQQSGSGQVGVEALPMMFGWPTDKVHPDLAILRKVVLLQSYDVYSLRISLREQNIPVNDFESLRLSPEKAAELTKYMIMFTRPLTKLIYGNDSVDVNSYDDLLRLFRDPDVEKARERLLSMARSLNIEVMEVPRFLENYGDTFMSLSYFKHCLDRLAPYFSSCIDSIEEIRKHFQLRHNLSLMKTCNVIEDVVNSVSASITGRLEVFHKRAQDLWDNMSQEQFATIKGMVEREHTTIGAALCGLTVKMNAYATMFPHPQLGGPVRRADFMLGEMIQGIEAIRQIEKRYAESTN